jgi:serine/threonine-protein kinase
VTPVSISHGAYVVGQALGRGGSARVFRAQRSSDGREVAAKVIPVGELEDAAALVARYQRIAELEHPNILRIFDVGISDEMLFVISPIAAEGSLRQLLQRGQLQHDLALRLIGQLADALDYLHRRDILHLDVKPANVLLAAGRHPLLGDFGLLPPRSSRIRGTPAYMSPEQCRLGPVGPAADQYALAVCSFELLTGQRPFVGGSPYTLLRRQVAEPPPPPTSVCPGLPADVDRVLLKALAKDPHQRFPTVEAMAAALIRAMAGAGPAAPPPRRRASDDERTLEVVTIDLGGHHL